MMLRRISSILCIGLFILHYINGQRLSPCPSVFDYERTNYDGRWDGHLRIQTDEELSGVFITIVLDDVADRLVNWFGETVTRNNKEFTIRNNDYILVPGINVSVNFYVEFSDVDIPSVTTVRLNGRTICSDRKKVKPIPSPTPFVSRIITTKSVPEYVTETAVTSQYYNNYNGVHKTTTHRNINELLRDANSHNFNPANSERKHTSTSSSDVETSGDKSYQAYDPNKFLPPTPSRFGTTRIPEDKNTQRVGEDSRDRISNAQSNDGNGRTDDTDGIGAQPLLLATDRQQCGKRSSIDVSPLILYGRNSTEGEWPWHVALYMNSKGTLKYICGGTLISDRFVVTAAHCVISQQNGQTLAPNSFLIYIGTTSIRNFSPSVQIAQISKIRIHPEYNRQNYHNDIAILRTMKRLELNNFVKPVCLWSDDDDIKNVVGVLGIVVGWGLDENNRVSEILKKTEMPIVDTVKCIYSNPDFFAKFTSLNSFCAGFRNGSSACNGDSGSGLVMSKAEGDGEISWYLRGLVSISVPIKDRSICNPYEYIVFTDVAKFVPWIQRVMRVES